MEPLLSYWVVTVAGPGFQTQRVGVLARTSDRACQKACRIAKSPVVVGFSRIQEVQDQAEDLVREALERAAYDSMVALKRRQ